MGNPPVAKFPEKGSVQVAVFAGDEGKFFSMINKSYRSKDGTWKRAGSYNLQDLYIIQTAVQSAINWIDAQSHDQTPPAKLAEAPAPEAEYEDDKDIPW